jgi:hypothetical protein
MNLIDQASFEKHADLEPEILPSRTRYIFSIGYLTPIETGYCLPYPYSDDGDIIFP